MPPAAAISTEIDAEAGGVRAGRPVRDAGAPPTVGRHVILRDVTQADFEFLYGICTGLASGYRWRYRGGTPRREQFAQHLWSDVLSQRLVVRKDTGEPIGLVLCDKANFVDGYAQFAAIGSPRYVGSGAIVEGAVLFLDSVFRSWNFRKLYMEAPEFNIAQIKSGLGRFFHEEGRLKAHHYYDGRYYDQLLLALYREDFDQLSPVFNAAFGPTNLPGGALSAGFRSQGWFDGPLDLERFCRLISEEFQRPIEWVVPDARLREDLGLDSLEMVTLIVIVDSVSGAAVGPPDAFLRFTTVREAFLYYCEASSMPESLGS
ncbi:MAG: phosphopantetheine-binding protein [Acidimicrobiales bacterium]